MSLETPSKRATSQIFGHDSSKTGHDYFVYGSFHVIRRDSARSNRSSRMHWAIIGMRSNGMKFDIRE